MGFSLDYWERLLPGCLPSLQITAKFQASAPTRPAPPGSTGDPDPWLPATAEDANAAADADPPRCSGLPPGARSGWRSALRPLGPAGAWCRRDVGSTGLQGFLSLGFSQLSADWTAAEPARVACAHATPPPSVLMYSPPHHHRHILLSTLFFSSSESSSPSSLYPVQCELSLGRIHWQTLPLDLLFFISHNQRRKGQLTEGEGGPEITERMC